MTKYAASISVSDFRGRLAEILEEVEAGSRYSLTVKGRTVAELLPPSTPSAVATRLLKVVRDMRRITPAQLAEAVGMRLGALDSYMTGENDPDGKVLEALAERFHLNAAWLKFGKGVPYKTLSLEFWDAELFDYLQRLAPTRITCLMEDPRTQIKDPERFHGYATILLGWDDMTYMAASSTLHVSTANGAGGYGRLQSFAALCRRLSTEKTCAVYGSIIPQADLLALTNGELWGGVVARSGPPSNWWDDFWDITHRFPIATSYESNYGKAFVDAQRALRQM